MAVCFFKDFLRLNNLKFGSGQTDGHMDTKLTLFDGHILFVTIWPRNLHLLSPMSSIVPLGQLICKI